MDNLSETVLARMAAGEVAALEEIMDFYGPLLCTLITQRHNSEETTTDVYQFVFRNVWEFRKDFKDVESLNRFIAGASCLRSLKYGETAVPVA